MMEHLRGKHDVERLLIEVRRVLIPGGHFIALGPNMRFLPGRYWDFWDHVVPITDKSLLEILTYLDFHIIDCHPKFLPYTTQSRYPRAPALVRLYLKMPLAWKIIGRQFLIRGRKV